MVTKFTSRKHAKAYSPRRDYHYELGFEQTLEGDWFEFGIGNGCNYGCKIYRNHYNNDQVLHHNSAYGCNVAKVL